MAFLLLLSLLNANQALEIDVWFDREDPVYYPTDNLKIFFRANQDCYCAVYNIEIGGRENMLFPLEGESGWIKADRTYELPPDAADYDYVVGGPEGTETIVVIASPTRLPDLLDEGPDVVRETAEIYIEEPEPAVLRIISTPGNCRIYITAVEFDDGEYRGTAPRTIVLRPGEYVVKITKFGYRTLTRRIWLEPGERRRVFVKLIPY